MRSGWFEIVSGARTGAGASLARAGLAALAVPYAAATWARAWLYRHSILAAGGAGIPVISVGNITVGGTGKTPLVEHLARGLVARGRRPAVVMRGYAATAGSGSDEAAVLRANLGDGVPVVEDPDRRRGAETAAREFGADVAVLDDGFQHLRLRRDLDVVALDATSPFGFGRLLPAGCLRESPRALARAGVIVVTRTELPPERDVENLREHVRLFAPEALVAASTYAPVRLEPLAADAGAALEDLDGARVAAFCGIGNPHAFGMALRRVGADVVLAERFADHHPFTRDELARVAGEAAARGAALVLTTQKDAARIDPGAWPGGAPPLYVVRAEFAFADGEEEFWAAVERAILRPGDDTLRGASPGGAADR